MLLRLSLGSNCWNPSVRALPDILILMPFLVTIVTTIQPFVSPTGNQINTSMFCPAWKCTPRLSHPHVSNVTMNCTQQQVCSWPADHYWANGEPILHKSSSFPVFSPDTRNLISREISASYVITIQEMLWFSCRIFKKIFNVFPMSRDCWQLLHSVFMLSPMTSMDGIIRMCPRYFF